MELKKSDKWLDASRFKPPKSGYYEIKTEGYSDDIGKYKRGLFGIPWLCYWTDETLGLRKVTYWREMK